jgi:hypothetical protein
MVMKLFVPSFETAELGVQWVVLKSELCCKVQSVQVFGQEMFRPLPERVIANRGIVGVAGDWLGFASRPMKRRLPDWVSRMKKMNG